MPNPVESTPSAADALPDGVLPVVKPSGWTSHDVVARVRRAFRLRKVGHGGTLDPMATGLLLLLVGRGTKLSDRIMSGDKVYEGVMRLGVSTDTQDVDGNVVATRDASAVTASDLEREMRARTGDILQTPPMVSAVKKDGVPLYKLARKGKTVEREPRLIHIYRFSLEQFEPPRAHFTLHCTKGTYVRTLCSEIGDSLGCGAFLERLARTRSGSYTLAEARPLEDLLQMDRSGLAQCIIPLHTALRREA